MKKRTLKPKLSLTKKTIKVLNPAYANQVKGEGSWPSVCFLVSCLTCHQV
ncbi:class I lanthipeptide [Chitinophaga solisilvae]